MAATPASIETHYVNSFRDGLVAEFQKTESLLQPFVELTPQNSEEQFYDRIGIAEDMKKDETRYGTNPFSEIDFDRRKSTLEDWEWGKAIEPKDLLRVTTDPSNEYTQAGIWAARRKQDDIIMDGVFASAWTGKKGTVEVKWVDSGTTAYSGKVKVGSKTTGNRNPITTAGRYVVDATSGVHTEGVVVAHDYVDSGTAAASGLTLAKLRAYKRTLLRLEILNPQDPVNLLVDEQQLDDLLNIEEVINGDYAVRKSLAEGYVTTFMGYRFIPYTGLPKDANGYTRCIAMISQTKMGSRAGMKLCQALPLTVNMWNLTERKNIPYVYIKMNAKAIRMWGELVGEIKCSY